MENLRFNPVLSCEGAKEFEEIFLGEDGERVRGAMRAAGLGVAEGVLKDFEEAGGFPEDESGRVLVLVGKGHNGGDALIAAGEVLRRYPRASAEVRFVFGERAMRENSREAWREFYEAHGERAEVVETISGEYALCLDGVFGFSFAGELSAEVKAIFEAVNEARIWMRAAVDLPSGIGAQGAFRADFTYATGLVKEPVLGLENAGRLRVVDAGFSKWTDCAETERLEKVCEGVGDFVLDERVLGGLRGFREARINKYDKGHLFILGGSLLYPGAVLMSVKAALRSGVGLVTAFVPGSLVSAFAAEAPEAMWMGCPETPHGLLAPETVFLLRKRMGRATALLVGPGLGVDPSVLTVVREIVINSEHPVVMDASALQGSVVGAGRVRRILTPHAGEFERICVGETLKEFSERRGEDVVTVLKGPTTEIGLSGASYHSFFGGPVLARGGSGDVLAGLIGGILAQEPDDLFGAAAQGVVWHGVASGLLARARGETAVTAMDLLEFLPTALRKGRGQKTEFRG